MAPDEQPERVERRGVVASRTDPRVNTLRVLFRHLHQFRSLFESEGICEITAPNGTIWSLLDIEYLYTAAMRRPTGVKEFDRAHPCLPLRQQQAIELFLVLNKPEDKAAEIMGLSHTNPVGMYATSGLTKLLKLLDEGHLTRFAPDSVAMFAVA
jgi:hypothetical protein